MLELEVISQNEMKIFHKIGFFFFFYVTESFETIIDACIWLRDFISNAASFSSKLNNCVSCLYEASPAAAVQVLQ